MSVPTIIQSATFDHDNATATDHSVTLGSAVIQSGGAVGPAALGLAIVYPNGTGGIGTSVTDSNNNTYIKDLNLPNSANGFTLEIWHAVNCRNGYSAPVITWHGSSSVVAVGIAFELDQIWPQSPYSATPTDPLDKINSRVDVTSSTNRSSGTGTKRTGMIDVFVGVMGWNDTRTVGTLTFPWANKVTIKGATTNLGVAIECKTAEVQNLAATQNVATFPMSGSAGTQPAAVACLSFLRNKVLTSNEDGALDNLQNVVTKLTASPSGVYRSSTSAPQGDIASSEVQTAYAFFPQLYLLSGATMAENYNWVFNLTDGYDGMEGYAPESGSYKNNQLGSTLDTGDYGASIDHYIYLPTYVDLDVWGIQTVPLTKSADFNTAGVTAMDIHMVSSDVVNPSTYGDIATIAGNIAQYFVLDIEYPYFHRDLSLAPDVLRFGDDEEELIRL